MRKLILLVFAAILLISCNFNEPQITSVIDEEGPIRLHPENPHYFLYKGNPLALITSAEHYGALINLDFDYKTYLETLAADGMNYTRIFTGTYYEISGESFGISNNTLAPLKNRLITPWAIVIEGLSGNFRYDLTSWNEAYFARLKDFMSLAAEKDIIVEVTLFSSIYRDRHWEISPQNPVNNVNMSKDISLKDAQTLNNGELWKFQEMFVRKMVNELNDFDNFFFEIQNEPWADHSEAVFNIMNKEELKEGDWTFKADFADAQSLAWQEQIANTITDEENKLEKKHLIAQNYTNFLAPIPEVTENISIINFHYAWPEAVEWNYHYNKVIGFDESGFAGSEDIVYRRQAWKFMLSGGGLFNNLDYSFYAGNEDGKAVNDAPGGGSAELRRQLRILNEFLHSFELEKLKPCCTCNLASPGIISYILSDENKSFAIYLRGVSTEKSSLTLKTGEGFYSIQSLNTITGEYSTITEMETVEDILNLDVIIPDGEVAYKIVRI